MTSICLTEEYFFCDDDDLHLISDYPCIKVNCINTLLAKCMSIGLHIITIKLFRLQVTHQCSLGLHLYLRVATSDREPSLSSNASESPS